jgi:hypothetical protein
MISNLQLEVLRQKIRDYVAAHPLVDGEKCARKVGGLDKYGRLTEDYLVAFGDVMEERKRSELL